jgi:predicted kinase
LKQRSERYANLFRIAEAVLQSQLPLVIDGTFENRRERMRLTSLATKYNYPLLVAYCYSSDEQAVAKRFAHRLNNATGPDHRASSVAIYYDSVKRFTRVSEHEQRKYDAYFEIDSAAKRVTGGATESEMWARVIHEIEQAYKEIHW